MNKPLYLFILQIFALAFVNAQPQPGNSPHAHPQNPDTARIAAIIPDNIALAPLIYLASDQLKGRCIGSPGIDSAASYIVGQLRKAGARLAPGAATYFQTFTRPFYRHDFDKVGIGVRYNFPRGGFTKDIELHNIIACIPGTVPTLRKQYVMLSAHYDHVGIADAPIIEEGKLDSIFNGARDNATGTAAVLAAVRYFGKHPPRRSVLIVLFTAEEEGEFGSKYYADHPLVPPEQTVFDLNVDNAGYNTTHAICLFGLGRTTADTLIENACHEYGLAVFAEPPGLQLFERSDNYNAAQLGIPAPCFSLGMTQWDQRIDRYYHRRSDEVENMDLNYIVKFIHAYILSAQYIANDSDEPRWTTGDSFEKLWQNLHAPPTHLNATPQRAALPNPAHPWPRQ